MEESPVEGGQDAESVGEQPLTAEELAQREEAAFVEKMYEQREVMHGCESSDEEKNAAAAFILEGSLRFRPEDAVWWINDVIGVVGLDDVLMSRACGMALDYNLAELFNAASEARDKGDILETIKRISLHGPPEQSQRACGIALELDLVGFFQSGPDAKIKKLIIDLLSYLLNSGLKSQSERACEVALQLDWADIFNGAVKAAEKLEVLEIIQRMFRVGSKEQKQRACEVGLRLDLVALSPNHLIDVFRFLAEVMDVGSDEQKQRAYEVALHLDLVALSANHLAEVLGFLEDVMRVGPEDQKRRAGEVFFSLDLINRVTGDNDAETTASILRAFTGLMLYGTGADKTRAFGELEKLDLLDLFRREGSADARKAIFDLFHSGLLQDCLVSDGRFSRMALELGGMLAGPAKSPDYLEGLDQYVVRSFIQILAEKGPEETRDTVRSWLDREVGDAVQRGDG